MWQHHPGTLSLLYAKNMQNSSVWWAWCGCHGNCYQGIVLPSQSRSIPLSLLLSDDITLSMPSALSWVHKGAWERQQTQAIGKSIEMKRENNCIVRFFTLIPQSCKTRA